ncbi:hypothetical protein RWE15_19490 [Virgibacillus halophilus]|uniref:YfhD-like protein n=1 Tax=Tigheibacillus halophilus TaxID=361280 RepID=A0ABU5C9X8_9BACI|nr:hypothetical protein [Virgibacillus halophilus]
MSEANRHRDKDKGNQRNVKKYDTSPKGKDDVEIAEDTEFLNINNKKE